MRLAIVGSRGLTIDCATLEELVPPETTAIISGGARGVDTAAAEYARSRDLELIEIRPDYRRYGRAAPLRRNKEIVDQADQVLAVWDNHSRGTASVIEYCMQAGKPLVIHVRPLAAHVP